jgi:MFS transporter, DHA2 family, multidrug resistance protein
VTAPRQVNPWVVAVAVMFATFMEVLDTTVVNVSLPHIAGSLSATIEEATWAITSYLVANAIILPMTGWLASRFGRKNLLLWATTGFTLTSFLCGIAPNLESLIVFRIMQGATGGALQPLSQAVLLESFAPHDRGKAMAFWALGIVVAPIMGPVLGGWLTDTYSWRWVFYINLPVGIASVVMTKMYVFDPPYIRQENRGIDYWGIGMLAVGIGALQIVLDKGQQEDWFESRFITVLVILSALMLVALIVHELTTKEPVIDLHVFRERSYAVGVFLMSIVGFVLYGSMVLLPIMLQTLLGYPSMQAGIAMAPRGLGSFLTMPIIGVLTGRVDPRKLLACGLVVGGTTLLWLGQLNLQAGYWDIFWPQFLQGSGMALLFVPLTTVAMANIRPERMGNATSLFNLMRNIGGSVGIAVTATMLSRQRQVVGTMLGENVNAYDPQTQSMMAQLQAGFMAAGADATVAAQRAYAAIYGLVQRQAAMVSFVYIFRLLGMLFIVLVPLVLVMKRPPRRAGPPPGAH